MSKQHFETDLFDKIIKQHKAVYAALEEIHEAVMLHCPKIASSKELVSALVNAVTKYYSDNSPKKVFSDFEAEFYGNKTTVQTIFYILCDIEDALCKAYPDIEEHTEMHHLMTLLFKAVTNYYHNSDNFNEAEFYSDVAYAISEGEAVPIACFQEFNEEFLMSIAY